MKSFGQEIGSILSYEQKHFMNNTAIPILDEVQDTTSLKDLTEIFWNLCLWEKDRASTLDTKASYLVGLSGIASAVIAVGGSEKDLLLFAGISLFLFTATVGFSLYCLLGRMYGGFNDEDTFQSLRAHIQPIGDIKAFEYKDPRRCFLREIILQRWLIYRQHSQENDSKYKWLIVAQISAIFSVLSLFGFLYGMLDVGG